MDREANLKVGDRVQIREWFDMVNEFGVMVMEIYHVKMYL